MRVIRSDVKPWFRLGICSLFLVSIWCLMLPEISKIELVRQWIEPLKREGINPSAVYYTEVFE